MIADSLALWVVVVIPLSIVMVLSLRLWCHYFLFPFTRHAQTQPRRRRAQSENSATYARKASGTGLSANAHGALSPRLQRRNNHGGPAAAASDPTTRAASLTSALPHSQATAPSPGKMSPLSSSGDTAAVAGESHSISRSNSNSVGL